MHKRAILPSRGASIKPSARKSIHHHSEFCPFAHQEAMGKYGLPNHNINNQDRPSQYETDETDNVVSKFIRPSSPINLKRSEQRKSSLPPLDQWNNISSNGNTLAKSLPAYLPSYSYCRNVSDDDSEEDIELNTSSRSSHEHDSSNNSDYAHNNSSNLGQELKTGQRRHNTHNKSYFVFALYMGLISLGIIVAYYIQLHYSKEMYNKNKIIYDENKFFDDVNYLGEKYKIKDDIILHVQSGISTIFKRNDTGSFIFVYDSETSNFNIIKFNRFIDDIATAAARYLRNESRPDHHLSLDSSELNMETHSEFINKYRNVVNDMGIMLIKNIERVPSKLAMAFHYYCDEYNPLVKRSAIFFTLDVRKCFNFSDQHSNHAYIEKCLANKWSTIPVDNIRPLLARVVNVIINVPSVF